MSSSLNDDQVTLAGDDSSEAESDTTEVDPGRPAPFLSAPVIEPPSMAMEDLPSGPLYEVRRSRGKGVGMFATDDIIRGTRILTEKPLIRIGVNVVDPVGLFALVAYKGQLTPAERQKFLSLHCRPERPADRVMDQFLPEPICSDPDGPTELSRVRRAFITNAFDSEEGMMCGYVQARINHSCTPNVCLSFNKRTGRITLHAIKDFPAGSEYFVSYVDEVSLSTSQRQEKFNRVYGFQCDCPACVRAPGSLTAPVGGISQAQMLSDGQIRRARLRPLTKDIKGWGADKTFGSRVVHYERGIKAVEEAIELLNEEGLVGMELTNCYENATAFSLSRKNWVNVINWAEKGMEQIQACQGRDSVAYAHGDKLLGEWKILRDTGGRG